MAVPPAHLGAVCPRSVLSLSPFPQPYSLSFTPWALSCPRSATLSASQARMTWWL